MTMDPLDMFGLNRTATPPYPGPVNSAPASATAPPAQEFVELDLAKTSIKVSRESPIFKGNDGGWYKSYPGTDLNQIEELIARDFEAGEYTVEIWSDGQFFKSFRVRISGNRSRDKLGNIMAEPAPPPASPGIRHEPFGLSVERPMSHTQGSDREALMTRINALQEAVGAEQKLRMKAEAQRDEHFEKLRKLEIEAVRMETRIDHLKSELEREQRHASDRVKAAQESGSSPMMTTLLTHVLDTKKSETTQQSPMAVAKEVLGFAKEMRELGGGGDDSGSLAQVLHEFTGLAQAFQASSMMSQPPNGAAPPGPQQPQGPTVPPPLAKAEGAYGGAAFVKHLSEGIHNTPEPQAWAIEAAGLLTATGRAELAKCSDVNALEAWVGKGVAGLHLSTLKVALTSKPSRAQWFFSAFRYLKGAIANG